MLLIRVVIGKVANTNRLVGLLRNIAIKKGEPGWNCVVRVREALEVLRADGKALGTAVTE